MKRKQFDIMKVKYKKNGRQPSKGLDCYGLAKVMYKRRGIDLPEFGTNTENYRNINNLVIGARNHFVKLSFPEPHCIVTLMIHRPFVDHIGVMLEDNVHFIHIARNIGVNINSTTDPLWADRIEGYYRWQK